MKTQQIIKILKKNSNILKQKFDVQALYVFGSVARGEASSKSDIDMLVEYSTAEVSIFDFVRLRDFLEEVIGKRVDLVTQDAIKEWMRTEIEKDRVRVA